ncbi:MAG: amidase/aspartyl-tRNA(Asn)/glutamyl-tRNA(Gln) amidotransferase subunit A [Oceanicoccus sp.]|jgi:amidase/aspartyl-tRNA(Asn)/glutamyl-tRNA(Gln) amidotransferase subunit A
MDGEQLGPLAGVPIIIKESINIAPPCTAGWAPLSKQAGGIELIPTADTPMV